MSNPDDENLEPKDFDLLGDDTLPTESPGEPMALEPLGDELPTEPLGDLSAAEPSADMPPLEPLADVPGIEPLEDSASPGLAGLPGAPPVAGDQLEDITPARKKKKRKKALAGEPSAGPEESLWQRLAKTSPYTVLLGLSLLALLIGALFFVLELRLYNYDMGAKEAKQRVMAPSASWSPPGTTVAA